MTHASTPTPGLFSKQFWKAAAERAVKTFAQSAAALLTANAVGLLDADWTGIASVSGLAALVSVLTSVGSAGLNGSGPSLASEFLDSK